MPTAVKKPDTLLDELRAIADGSDGESWGPWDSVQSVLREAIAVLSARPEVERIEPDGITRKMQHINSETVYVCPAREDGKYECWRYTDGWKLIDPQLPQSSGS